jgi:hypothetical protein
MDILVTKPTDLEGYVLIPNVTTEKVHSYFRETEPGVWKNISALTFDTLERNASIDLLLIEIKRAKNDMDAVIIRLGSPLEALQDFGLRFDAHSIFFNL